MNSINNPYDGPTWERMLAIKSRILRIWDSANIGVRICCIKFAQRVVMVQTAGPDADPKVYISLYIHCSLVTDLCFSARYPSRSIPHYGPAESRPPCSSKPRSRSVRSIRQDAGSIPGEYKVRTSCYNANGHPLTTTAMLYLLMPL